jgi:selenocysteine-specific elongation factor
MDVVIGTAGHIDHGKTALIKALTGVDADRLPEEKRRGITVDLGFAEMTVGDVHCGFVDVPGHERFVKNMLAGASGIDVVMLVIAAAEGIMPQTREHFDICRLLGVAAGIVVFTKADLVDVETLELARLEAAELVAHSFLENAPMVSVSSRNGEGIDELKAAIEQIAQSLPARKDQLVLRLPIDRSFSMKGFGAVVTGTLASGEIREGDELELLPDGKSVRVRGLQTHGNAVKTATAGRRVAVNLGGVDHSAIERGMTLVPPGTLHPTQIFDAEIEVLATAARPLRSRQRVRVHIGTKEVLARLQILNDTGEIAPGGRDLAQVRLEMPVVAVPGERFIIRSYSPQATIAGGSVIDTSAEKHRRKDIEKVRLHLHELLSASDDNSLAIRVILEAAGARGATVTDLRARTGFADKILTAAIDANVTSGSIASIGERYIRTDKFNELAKTIESAIRDFHKREPLAKGISREVLQKKVARAVPAETFLPLLAAMEQNGSIVPDKETVRLVSHETQLSPDEAAVSQKLLAAYKRAGLEVPKLDDALAQAVARTKLDVQRARKLFQIILNSGEIVKISDEFYFSKNAIEHLAGLLRKFAAETDGRMIDVPKFKELAGISRKYAIPLLEYFDREHITSRAGDKRVIL